MATENRPPDSVTGLVSLAFIKAAVRRSARLLFVMAIVGLLVGSGVCEMPAHQYQAAASVLVTLSPCDNPQTAAVDDQAMAETRSVAGLAVHELGLQQSASSFLSTYSAAYVTERLLTITANAPSASRPCFEQCRGQRLPQVPGR